MTEKEVYSRVALVVLIVGLGVVLFREMLPFLGGILGAFTIYVLVRRQMLYLTEKKQMKPSWAALLLLGEIVLVVLVPLSLMIWLFINKLQDFNLDTAALIAAAQHVSDLILEKTGYNIFNMDNVVSVATLLPKIGQSLMGNISSFAINAVTLLFVLYFMLVSIRPFEAYIYTLLPFSKRNKDRVVKEIYVLVKSNAIGIPLLAVIQGAIATIGYFIFQTPQPLVFGLITCVATVIPIVGTGLVWFPLAAYLALTGDWFNAIGLAIYALLVISNIDNLIRFMLQKQMADTHPLVTIFGVVIGLSLFGFIGVIFGPILIAAFLLCVNIFKEEFLDEKKKSNAEAG
ncbi:AI-2E family transporter [Parabacteroides sp. PF5-6]|uniref:AI-2E family transporter n=1 Tax=Parabacteroides sp. PF5-6 TaxID=1742403 RepID=UPI00240626EA|nr:AI-2E family transporter [Parabacteroides sp. PF5-6]MDF9831326.1 putative PurR-regulated permease PerM [Parabacteroides sp. PF5-6]